MKVATPQQMADIDSTAIHRYGIPGVVLMENASIAVVNEIISMLGETTAKRIVIAAGKGNNGGDGFAIARHLANMGAVVNVHVAASLSDISGDASVNLMILKKMNVDVFEILDREGMELFRHHVMQSDLVVDALFGTGLNGEVRGISADLIRAVNKHAGRVMSVDIPSGVNGETGECEGAVIMADCTVTFCLPKIGVIQPPGCEKAGRVIVADIGIPREIITGSDIRLDTIDREAVADLFFPREKQTSKGDYGKLLVISGSAGMTGSGSLAAFAALKSGAGLVYLGVPASLSHIYGALVAEPVVISMEDDGEGYMGENAAGILEDILPGKDVVAAGPGLSTCSGADRLVRRLIQTAGCPLVLDADALNIVAQDVSMLKSIKGGAVLTPHPGEMARLTGKSIEQVQNNRIQTARDFAMETGTVTVLKGYRTLVALPDGTVYINLNGNPGMATAGSGDVLTGIIAALAGQGLSIADSARAGVYIHGAAGDNAADELGQHGITASDIAKRIPVVIKAISQDGKKTRRSVKA